MSQQLAAKKNDTTWMKNHPLEGDNVVTGFYNFLIKRNPKTMKPCKDVFVPDTVVFEHNFPRGWYTTDIKAREVMRKQGRELDAATIEKGFTADVTDGCPIVATYLCTCEEDLGNGETESMTMVEVFNKDTIGEFLARKTKKEGILQKFVMPKGYHNSVIKAVWSPRVCMVQRRTNKYVILDKKRAEADPFATTVTYEGPTYLSEEGTVSGNISVNIKKICGHIVQHFYYTEHKFITRMVLYFKADKQDRLWFLWCGSLRVSDRNTNSEMPVNLITNFIEPTTTSSFNEDRLLWDADQAFLRVTNDEMFYETYMKRAAYVDEASDGTTPRGTSKVLTAHDTDGTAANNTTSTVDFDWSSTPVLVQEAHSRLTLQREAMLSAFEDIFYKARSHFVVKKNVRYTLEVPQRVVETLTPIGVVDIMRMLHLPAKGDGEDGSMRYNMEPDPVMPITKMLDDTLRWVNDHYTKRIERLRDASIKLGDNADALMEEITVI